MAHKARPRPAPVPPPDLDHRPFDDATLADIIKKTGHPAETNCLAFDDAMNRLNLSAIRLKQVQESKALPTASDRLCCTNRLMTEVTLSPGGLIQRLQ